MTTAYSTNLELALPVQGELSGTWGNTVNNGITQYLDAAIAGSQIISGSQTAVTLTNTNGDDVASNIAQAGSGATGTAQYQIIRCTGNPASLLTITISDTGVAGYSKTFIIINATSTSQSVKIVGSGPTTGITVASGAKSLVAWNGSDFVEIASSTADGVTTFSAGTTGLTPNTATTGAITLAGTLATANGGTGLSGATPFTSGGVVYASSTSALATGSALTFDGTTQTQTVGDGAYSNKWKGATGLVRFRPYIDATVGSLFEAINSAESAYIPLTLTGSNLRLDLGSNLIGIINGTEGMRLTSAGLLVGGTAARGTTAGTAHLDLFNGTAPAGTLTNGVSLYSASGDLKFMNAAGDAFDVGYRNIPQNVQTGSYTLTLADAGDHIYRGSGGAATWTIPAASSVAYPLGTAITFINLSATAVSIAITTDTMYLSSAGTTGTRTLAQYGSATAIKVSGVSSSGIWVISGSGLT